MLLSTALGEGGERPLVTVDGRALTGPDLLAAAAAVADRIEGAGRAAVHAEPSLETIVAVVGCLLAGVTAVPVPADAGPRERAHILADSAASLWLGARPDDVTIEAVAVGGRSATTWTEPADGDALVMYTSGTTGPPKGVPVTRAAVAACLDGLADAWDWQPDDTLVHGLPLFHVHGLVLGVLGALRVGSALIHTGRPTPEAYATAHGTLYFGVPTVWRRIAADPAAAAELRTARLLVSGSAGLPAPVFDDLLTLSGQGPVERYGMTETLITLAARADRERRAGWVGTPIAGVDSRVLDDSGEPVAADGESIGSLEIAGTTVFNGYLGLPEVTRASFTDDGWFRTGDAATLAADGSHRIVGRAKDDLIKTGGYRVGAGEIEAVLLGHPDVSDVAVIGAPDDDLGQRIVAYVVGSGVSEAALISFVATTLSAHKRPREVRFVGALPRNEMGKVQKSKL
jgi:fatty acid CoA ligase FadD36